MDVVGTGDDTSAFGGMAVKEKLSGKVSTLHPYQIIAKGKWPTLAIWIPAIQGMFLGI